MDRKHIPLWIVLLWSIFVSAATSSPPLDLSQYPPNIIPFPDNTWVSVASCYEKWFSLDLSNFVSDKPFAFSVSISAMNDSFDFYVTEYMPQLNDALSTNGVLEGNWQTSSLYQQCQVPGSTPVQLIPPNQGVMVSASFSVWCNVKTIPYYVVVKNVSPNSMNGMVFLTSNFLYFPIPVEIQVNSTNNAVEVVSQTQFSTGLPQFSDLWKWSFFYFDIPTIIAERPGSTITVQILNKQPTAHPVAIHINRISPAIPTSTPSGCDLLSATDSYQFQSCFLVNGGRVFFTTVNPYPTLMKEYTVQLTYSRAPLLDLSLPPASSSIPTSSNRITKVGSMSINQQTDYYVLQNTMLLSQSDVANLQLFIVVDNVINGQVQTTVVTNATVLSIPFSCNTTICTTGEVNGGCQFSYDECIIPGANFMVGVRVVDTFFSDQPLYYTVSAVLLPIPMYPLSLHQGYVETVGSVEPGHILRYSINHGLTGLPGQSLSIYLYTNQNARGSVLLDISSTPNVGNGCTFTRNVSHTCNLYAPSPKLSCSIQLLPCDLQYYGPTLYISVTGQNWMSDETYYWHSDTMLFTMSVQTRVPQSIEINQIYDHSVKQGEWAWYSITPFTGTLFLEVIEPVESNLLNMYLMRLPSNLVDDANSPGCSLFDSINAEYFIVRGGDVTASTFYQCPACNTYQYFLVVEGLTKSSDLLDLEYTITTGSIVQPLYEFSATSNVPKIPNMINYEAASLSVTGDSGLQLNDLQLNYTYILDISTEQVDAGNKILQISFDLPECLTGGQSVNMVAYYIPRNQSERAECIMSIQNTFISSYSSSCTGAIALSVSPCDLQSHFVSRYNDILIQIFFTPGSLVDTMGHKLASIIYEFVDITTFQVSNLAENQVVSIDTTPSITIFNIQLDSNSISPPSTKVVYIEIMAPVNMQVPSNEVLSVDVYQVPDSYGLQCGLPYNTAINLFSTSSFSSTSMNEGYLVFPFRACELYYRWNITNGYNLIIQTTFQQISFSTVATISWSYVDESIPSVLSGLTFKNGAIIPVSDNMQPHVYKYFSLSIGPDDLNSTLIVYVYSDIVIHQRQGGMMTLLVNSPAVGSGVLPNVDCGCYEVIQTFEDYAWYIVDPCMLMTGTYTFGVVYSTNTSVTQEVSGFTMQDFPTILPKYTATATLADLYVPLDIDFPTNHIIVPNQTVIFYFTITPTMLGTTRDSSKVIYFLGTTQINSTFVTFRLTATKDPCSCPTPPPFSDIICSTRNCVFSLAYCDNYNGTIYVVASTQSSTEGNLQIPFTTQLVTATNQGSFLVTPSSTCDQSDYQVYTINSLYKMLYFDLQSPSQVTINIESVEGANLNLFTSFGPFPALAACNNGSYLCSSLDSDPSEPFNCSFDLTCVQQFSISINELTNNAFSTFQPVSFSMLICDLASSTPVTLATDGTLATIPLLYPEYTANYSLSLSSITFTPDLVIIFEADVQGLVEITFIQEYSSCSSLTCSETALPNLSMTCGGSSSSQDTCIMTVTNCMLPSSVNTTIPWYIRVTNIDNAMNASGTLKVTIQQVSQNTLSLTPNTPVTLVLKPYTIQLIQFQITDTDLPDSGLYTASLDTTLNTFKPATKNNRTGSLVYPELVIGTDNLPLPVPAFSTSYLSGTPITLYPTCDTWSAKTLTSPGVSNSYPLFSSNPVVVCPFASCNLVIPTTVYGLFINMDKYNSANVTFTGTITQTRTLYNLNVPGTVVVNGSASIPAVASMQVPPLTRGQYFKLTLDVQTTVVTTVYYKVYPASILVPNQCDTESYISFSSASPGLSNQLLTWDACTAVDEKAPGYNLQVVIYSSEPSAVLVVKSSVVSPIQLVVGGPSLSGTLSEPYNLVVFNLSSIPTDVTANVVLNYYKTFSGPNWNASFADNRNTFPSLPIGANVDNPLSCAVVSTAVPSGSFFSPLQPCSNNGIPLDYFITFLAIQTNPNSSITYHINATVYVNPIVPRSFPMSLTSVNVSNNQVYYLEAPPDSMSYYTVHMESVDGASFTVQSNDGCVSSSNWQSFNEGTCSGRCVFPVLSCLFTSPLNDKLYFQISWSVGSTYRQFLLNYTVDTITPTPLAPNFVKGGSLTSGQAIFFHYNSSVKYSSSSDYWSPLTSMSFTFISDQIPCGGLVNLYESWVVPGISGCSSSFNSQSFNFISSHYSEWTENIYLADVDYWIIVVPQWDLDIDHVPLTFFIEVSPSLPTIYVPLHENQIRQLNFSLSEPTTSSDVCFPDFANNTISCSNGCGSPTINSLTINIPQVTYIYEFLHTGSALDDRVIFFSTPSYMLNVEFTVSFNEGHHSFSNSCYAPCSIFLPACEFNAPFIQYEIEVTATMTSTPYISAESYEILPPIYGYQEIPLASIWVERFSPPVTIIQGSTSLTKFYIDVQLSNNGNQFFKVLPPDNYPTFVGYLFEITKISQDAYLSVTEGWDVCASFPTYYCGCSPFSSNCQPNTAACMNSPPPTCVDTLRYPKVNRPSSCSNQGGNPNTQCQPWVVSTVPFLCSFCSGNNTFFISAVTSNVPTVTFQLTVTILPTVPTPPYPPPVGTCVAVPEYTQLPVPYLNIRPYFYLPSLTPTHGTDEYYLFQFSTNTQFLLAIVEYPVPFNTTAPFIYSGGICNSNTGSSTLNGINTCNLLYQPTPGSSAKPLIMVIFINSFSKSSYYFYTNESLQSVSSINVELGKTYQSPSETVPCEPVTYNLHYVIPSSVLSSVNALLVEAVGNGVSMDVYMTSRSLSSVSPFMIDSKVPVGHCTGNDCRIILACTLDTSANYFIEVNSVPLNLTVSSLAPVSSISLQSTSYKTLTYNTEDPTQNQWLTYSFDTSSPPHPLASVEFYFTGDLNPWIILTTTSTSSNILTTESSCTLGNYEGTSPSLIQVLPCQFSAYTPIYANVLPLQSDINCQSDAFQMSGNWQNSLAQKGGEFSLLPVFYNVTELPLGSLTPIYLQFSFPSAVEPEALLLVKGFSSSTSYTLIKGNLVQGAVWDSTCSSSCDNSAINYELPSASEQWLSGFPGANPRLLLDVYDVCFHCGDSYDTFYLQLSSLPAGFTPVLEKILPTTLSTTTLSQTIGEVTAPGLAYFVLNPLDTSRGQYIEIKVISGFVMGALYPSSSCPQWNQNSNLLRYKWCYEGETCRIIMVEPSNFPLGSSYTHYYLRVYGASTFSITLRYSQNAGCGSISSSLAPYCSGHTYTSSVLVFDNQIQPHDLYAGNLSNTIQNQFLDVLQLTELPADCVNAIRQFACAKGFEGCDDNGLVTYMPVSLCNAVESACGTTMSNANLPQLSCGHLNYTGSAEFISLVNSAPSLLASNIFLLTILLLASLLLLLP